MSEQQTLDDAAPDGKALMDGEYSPEELEAMLAAKDEEIAALQAKLAEFEAAMVETQAVAAGEQAQAQALTDRVNAQAAEVKALRESLETERAARVKALDDAEVRAWVSEGRIKPAEEAAFRTALAEKRAGREAFFAHAFGARKPGDAVPLSESGHAHAVKPATDPSEERHQARLAYMRENGCDYNSAHKALRAQEH